MPATYTSRLEGLTTSVAVKPPCRVATTTEIALFGLQTIDGVAVSAGDRVLVRAQSVTSQNGIWVANAAEWVRALDFDGSLDAVGGTQVSVQDGATYGSTYWRAEGDGPIRIGTDAITFSRALVNSSATVSFRQVGIGAIDRDSQDKLRDIIARADYSSDSTFNDAVAASPLKPSIAGNGDFGARVTPSGEPTQLALASATQPVSDGPRDAIVYASSTSVHLFRANAVMGGFRYRGHYTKAGRVPVYPMPASKIASVATGNVSLSATKFENWYAAFAVANDGDATATIVVMPFLRIAAPVGSVCGLIRAGEGVHDLVTTTNYAWTAANNLVGSDCLVISENGAFSGRVTKVTANAASSITLQTVGALAAGDFLLPAPPGYDHYVYLGSFYIDTAEVRNIYDTGTLVKAKMIYLLSPSVANGSFPPGAGSKTMLCAGYICPLATGVVIDSSCALSTGSTGSYAEYFDGDGGGHVFDTRYLEKTAAPTLTNYFSNVQIPFLYYQSFNFSNAGTLAGTRIDGQLNVTGWIEP